MEVNYKADPQLEAIRDMVVKKEPIFAERVRAMGGYLGQYTNDFHARDGCLWVVSLGGQAAGYSHSVTSTHHQSNPQLPSRKCQYVGRGKGHLATVYSPEPGVGRRGVGHVHSGR